MPIHTFIPNNTYLTPTMHLLYTIPTILLSTVLKIDIRYNLADETTLMDIMVRLFETSSDLHKLFDSWQSNELYDKQNSHLLDNDEQDQCYDLAIDEIMN